MLFKLLSHAVWTFRIFSSHHIGENGHLTHQTPAVSRGFSHQCHPVYPSGYKEDPKASTHGEERKLSYRTSHLPWAADERFMSCLCHRRVAS